MRGGEDLTMKYIVDHDYHIHSKLSRCSKDEEQTTERILKYAKENGLSEICLTDHFWDKTVNVPRKNFYHIQDLEYITQALPLPQSEDVKFYFGCETDMDKYMNVGISEETMEKMDFIAIPTTHMHMKWFTYEEQDDTLERRADLYVKRFTALLEKDLPWHKVGIAHPTCHLIAPGDWGNHIKVLNMISDEVFRELFEKTAVKGAGVELNMPIFKYNDEERVQVLRPYRIAAECGCKFYLGSDAHHPVELEKAKRNFETIVELLDLKEDQKFRFK